MEITTRIITCVESADMPREVADYCESCGISTCYQNDIVLLEDDENPFSEWLKTNGYEFKSEFGDYIGIFAT